MILAKRIMRSIPQQQGGGDDNLIEKKLDLKMNNNSWNGYVASASNTHESNKFQPYKAFNGVNNDFYHNANGTLTTQSLELKLMFNSPKKLSKITYYKRGGFLEQQPNILDVIGIKPDNTENIIATIHPLTTDGLSIEVVLDNNVYKGIKFLAHNADEAESGNWSVGEIEIYIKE